MELLYDDFSTIKFDADENPFKAIRRSSGLSQVLFAAKVGISKHAVLRSEQGMYAEPLPALLNYCTANFPVERIEIVNQYERFQLSHRQDSGLCLGAIDRLLNTVWGLGNTHDHPFIYLRRLYGFNTTSIAKALCVNQTVVTYFEKNPVAQKTVPEQIMNALKDCGYNELQLEALESAYRTYRTRLISRQNIKGKK